MILEFWIELIGYCGSALVAISLMMSKILKLRLINMCGAFIFVIYSWIISAYPILIVNLIIFIINIYYLSKILMRKDAFTILHIQSNKSVFLLKFIEFHNKDILKMFPDFNIETINYGQILLILRNMIPVGIFIARPNEEGQVEILIDYVIPEYRDFKNAIFLHSEEISKYRDEGFSTLVTATKNGVHRKYLLKMGYNQDDENKYLFRKDI